MWWIVCLKSEKRPWASREPLNFPHKCWICFFRFMLVLLMMLCMQFEFRLLFVCLPLSPCIKKSLFRFFGLTSISFRFGLEFFYLSWPIVIIIIIIIWSVLCTIIRFSDAIEYLFYNFFFASLHHLKLRLLLLFLIFFVWTILFFYITFGCCCFEFAHRMNKRTISTSKQK